LCFDLLKTYSLLVISNRLAGVCIYLTSYMYSLSKFKNPNLYRIIEIKRKKRA